MDTSQNIQPHDQQSEQRPYHALKVIPNVEDLILHSLSQGQSLKTIADRLGVTDVAVLRRVEDHPDYKAYRRIGLRLRMDQREQELEQADSNVSVTRADRLLGHARWLAERLDSETYGQRSHVTVEVGDLSDRLMRAKARVIDGSATVVQSNNSPAIEAIPESNCQD